MASKRKKTAKSSIPVANAGGSVSTGSVSNKTEELLLAALERGSDTLETGRYLVSYREGMLDAGIKSLRSQSFRIADARDFDNQAAALEDTGDADALILPEIGVAVIGGDSMRARGFDLQAEAAADGPIEIIEPEYFVFAESSEYLRGFSSAVNAIMRDIGGERAAPDEGGVEAEVLGVTWGLQACRVPPSTRSGTGIKVAVLDTGMDLGHPDFVGRAIVGQTFVGQPVQDLNGHGTHCIGTACGPKPHLRRQSADQFRQRYWRERSGRHQLGNR
jgi:subtilisin